MWIWLARWDYCLDKIEFLKFNKSFSQEKENEWKENKNQTLFFSFHTLVKTILETRELQNYHVLTVAFLLTSSIWVNLWVLPNTSNSEDLFLYF